MTFRAPPCRLAQNVNGFVRQQNRGLYHTGLEAQRSFGTVTGTARRSRGNYVASWAVPVLGRYVERFGDFFRMEGSEVHHFGESSSLLQQREMVQCFGDPVRFHHQETMNSQTLRSLFLTPLSGNDQTLNVSDINSDSIISKWLEDRYFGDNL